MLLDSGLFRYKGFGNCESFCDLSVYVKTDIQLGPKALVIMHENPANTGTSVTNSSEYIAVIVYNKYLKPKGIKPEEVFWVESSRESKEATEDDWDKVTYSWTKDVPEKPRWESTSRQFVEALKISMMEESNESQVQSKASGI